MLKKFTVSNYRSFEDPITLDFTKVGDYDFNEECIKNGVINKAIIYGENAVGKTSLGQAIFDVTTMISGADSWIKSLWLRSKNPGFINAKANDKVAKFTYIFQIGDCEIEYVYEKHGIDSICSESLKIDQALLYELNFDTGIGDFSSFQKYSELALLNLDNWNNQMSVLTYILSNTKLDNLSILKKFESFVKNMFNLSEMEFIGKNSADEVINGVEHLIIADLVFDFETFLREVGIDVSLKVATTFEGEKELYLDYESKMLRFVDYASSGTLSLVGLYLGIKVSNRTFMYIDEFDANFHFGAAKLMLEKFKNDSNCQTVITTHNTDLMSNKYMRPDCYLLMTPNKIVNLADATGRKLRMGHHLENLYQAGEFDEWVNQLGEEDE